MPQFKIIVVAGSLRRNSFNRQLTNAIIKLAPAEFAFQHAEIGGLPLYNEDDERFAA